MGPGVSPAEVFAELTERVGERRVAVERVSLGDPNRCLGVIFGFDPAAQPRHPFFRPLVEGMRARALERNADLLLCFPRRGRPDAGDAEAVDRCLRHGVDGIVLLGFLVRDDPGIAVRSARLPLLFVEHNLAVGQAGLVGIDNVAAMRSVVRHLIRLGHQRIAHIAGLSDAGPGKDRRDGYRLELEQQGLSIPDGYVREGDFGPISGYAATKELLALPEPPDAIAASSDGQAVGALVALAEAGLRCPQDVAVTGFDDAEYAATLDPPLTTVSQEAQELGADAVDALIQMIVFPRQPAPRLLREGRLVVRESCGAGNTGARGR